MLPASLSSLHNTAPLLQILTKLVFLLSFCGQGSTPQVCVCLLSSSNNLFACLVLNWPVLSLLLWRNTLRLRGHLPPPASPPSFGNPYKNSGRSWTKTIVASKKNWKDPSNRCHHTLPPPFSTSFSLQILPPYNSSVRNVLWVSSHLDKVPMCKPVCVRPRVRHTQNPWNPGGLFQCFSLNKTCLSA